MNIKKGIRSNESLKKVRQSTGTNKHSDKETKK